MEERRMVTLDRDGKVVRVEVHYEPLHRHPWGPFLIGSVLKLITVLLALTFSAGMLVMWLIDHHRI